MTISVSGHTLGPDGIHSIPKDLGKLDLDLADYVG